MKTFFSVFLAFVSLSSMAASVAVDGYVSAYGKPAFTVDYFGNQTNASGFFQNTDATGLPIGVVGFGNNNGTGIGVAGVGTTFGVYAENPRTGGIAVYAKGDISATGTITAQKFNGDATSVSGHSTDIVTFQSAQPGQTCELAGYIVLKTVDGQSAKIPYCK